MTLTHSHYKFKHDSDSFTHNICELSCFCYVVSRGYESPPKPSASRLESTASAFACGVLCLLKSKPMGNGYINLDLDCWHYITQGKGTPSHHIIGAIIYIIGVILVAFQCYLLTGGIILMYMGKVRK